MNPWRIDAAHAVPKPHAARRYRPMVERLEDRYAPSAGLDPALLGEPVEIDWSGDDGGFVENWAIDETAYVSEVYDFESTEWLETGYVEGGPAEEDYYFIFDESMVYADDETMPADEGQEYYDDGFTWDQWSSEETWYEEEWFDESNEGNSEEWYDETYLGEEDAEAQPIEDDWITIDDGGYVFDVGVAELGGDGSAAEVVPVPVVVPTPIRVGLPGTKPRLDQGGKLPVLTGTTGVWTFGLTSLSVSLATASSFATTNPRITRAAAAPAAPASMPVELRVESPSVAFAAAPALSAAPPLPLVEVSVVPAVADPLALLPAMIEMLSALDQPVFLPLPEPIVAGAAAVSLPSVTPEAEEPFQLASALFGVGVPVLETSDPLSLTWELNVGLDSSRGA